MSVLGIGCILLLAWACSSARRKIRWRPVFAGLAAQLFLGAILLKTPAGSWCFRIIDQAAKQLLACSDVGAQFIFGSSFREHFFAFAVLPSIIFFSALTSLLFYTGILQFFIRLVATCLGRIFAISGAEAMVASANLVLGQIESAFFAKNSLARIPNSQLFTIMTCGMGTISGCLVAVYAGMGIHAGYLLAATVMSIPASLAMAKMLYPDAPAESAPASAPAEMGRKEFGHNMLDAVCRGAQQGVKIALAIAACVLCFVAFTALANLLLQLCTGGALTMEGLLGYAFSPVAWLLGVPWQDAQTVGSLVGQNLVFNEYIAYSGLAKSSGALAPHSVIIATFALCGFANFGSIAIQIGGLGELAPERRSDIAAMSGRALLGAVLANWLTAGIAGLLL